MAVHSALAGPMRPLASVPDRHLLSRDHEDVHQTVRRATAIMEAIWRRPGSVRLAEVARETGLDRSTALRLLRSLEDLGYLHRDETTKAYRIGYMAQRLGARAQLIATDVALARPFVEDLAAATGATAVIAVLEGTSVIAHLCVAGMGVGRPLLLRPGVAYAAHASALGKALLGNLSPDALRLLYSETRLARLGTRTVADLDALANQVALARERGYASECDEGEEGRAGIALAGVNARGVANVAIGLLTRSSDFSADRERALVAAATRTAQAIYAHILC